MAAGGNDKCFFCGVFFIRQEVRDDEAQLSERRKFNAAAWGALKDAAGPQQRQ